MNDTNFNPDTTWRRVAAAMYKKPVDSKIFGSVEVDVTDLEQFITRKRQEGLKITLTHFFLLATARGFREVPAFNCFVRRGRIVQRPQIDATLSVLVKGSTEMGSVKVARADELTLAELAERLVRDLAESRQGTENQTMRIKDWLAAIPWPFRAWVLDAVKRVTISWGLPIPALGLSPDSLGSFVLSNIGSVGLDMGYPALLPASNVSMVLIVGSVQTKPAVVNGHIVPRRMLSLGAALDHRVVDGLHGGQLFRYIKRVIRQPTLLENPPDSNH